MTQDELREAIEGPAGVRVLFFQPSDLVDDLINDVLHTPGALPLLSFTLSELYRMYLRRGAADRALTSEDYRALGGVGGSLRNRANDEIANLPDDAHRDTMERVMLRMVSFEGGGLARRRVPRSELVYSTHDENARVATVLERLSNARLVSPTASRTAPLSSSRRTTRSSAVGIHCWSGRAARTIARACRGSNDAV
jgi:hypothetical protein